MEIIDCSTPITNDTVCYPGNTPVMIKRQRSMDLGDKFNVTDIAGSTHTGTHVDSAKHHYNEMPGVEGIPLNSLVARAYVIDLPRANISVTKDDIAYLKHMADFDILLLKTANSNKKEAKTSFDKAHTYISEEAAKYIVELGLKGVGIDCLSVEKFGSEYASTHKILLKDNKVAIIEGLNLEHVQQGFYFFVCLPLNIVDSDGAPARAILVPEGQLPSATNNIGIRRDGSYYTRIEWASHTSTNPYIWVNNLINDDIERNGGTWGANTYGPANAILSFFGEKKEIAMFRIFHNVGAPISILEELAKKVAIYASDDDICHRFGTEKANINSVKWEKVVEMEMEMSEKWTDIVLKKSVKAKYIRLELVINFQPSNDLPWCETRELKIYPPKN